MGRFRSMGDYVEASSFGESYFTYEDKKNSVTKWFADGSQEPGMVLPTRVTCLDELHAGPPYKTGGPFDLMRFETSQFSPMSSGEYKRSYIAGITYCYDGGFRPLWPPANDLPVVSEDWGDITSFGPAAWNRYRPTRPRCSLGQATVEFKDIPRMLKTSAFQFRERYSGPTHWSKRTADQWVNINFGWVPFLNDLSDFYKLTSKLNSRYQQLQRDNNKWVRRGGTVSSNSASSLIRSDTGTVGIWPGVQALSQNTSCYSRNYVLKQSQNVWFSARFKYHLPKNETWRWAKSMLMLYGMVPSPALVWELTPWSWLADWVSNFGDVTEWLSSMLFEDLCAKYAYVMGTTQNCVDCTCTGQDGHGQEISVKAYALQERKQRVPATSFGFGLTSSDFSARQWSILGALGLSRLS